MSGTGLCLFFFVTNQPLRQRPANQNKFFFVLCEQRGGFARRGTCQDGAKKESTGTRAFLQREASVVLPPSPVVLVLPQNKLASLWAPPPPHPPLHSPNRQSRTTQGYCGNSSYKQVKLRLWPHWLLPWPTAGNPERSMRGFFFLFFFPAFDSGNIVWGVLLG